MRTNFILPAGKRVEERSHYQQHLLLLLLLGLLLRFACTSVLFFLYRRQPALPKQGGFPAKGCGLFFGNQMGPRQISATPICQRSPYAKEKASETSRISCV